MSSEGSGPAGQYSQLASNNIHGNSRQKPVLALFSGAYILPNTTYGKDTWESDAQIAARKAMAKRSSRSYAARVSRTRSRKREMLARPAKPTLDTSFTKHKGNAPRQVFPKDSDLKSSGTIKMPAWLGLSRSEAKGKGLGIMKGTPQPEGQVEEFVASTNRDPKTAESLTPGSKAWMEISPSDRPIPIGISVPSDSVSDFDFSPYQSGRQRSDSDATLATPSIIITPAAAMKSVWSPDTATESEYTPSIYSRATFNAYATVSDVPPVPALPRDMVNASNEQSNNSSYQDKYASSPRARTGTLESAGTAFEDIDFDMKQKDRITSTGTVFEEDEMPLRDRQTQFSNLSLDTSMVPTPRRSHGWWNVITTPFEFSRTNSVWTQNGRNTEKTPDVPMMPQRFAEVPDSPSTTSSIIWSATEKSPSINGYSPRVPITFSTTTTRPTADESKRLDQAPYHTPEHSASDQGRANKSPPELIGGNELLTQNDGAHKHEKTSSRSERYVLSLLSAMPTSPNVNTAAVDTVSMPRQVPEQHQPIVVNIEFHEKQQHTEALSTNANSSYSPPTQPSIKGASAAPQSFQLGTPASRVIASQSPPHFPPPPVQQRNGSPAPAQEIKLNFQTSRFDSFGSGSHQFPPPPHFAQTASQSHYDRSSRASSPVSEFDLKAQKKHKKVFNIMDWLPFLRRGRHNKKQKKEKSRSRRWCLGCCCCLLILILIAIIVPVVVFVSKKHSNNSSDGKPGGKPSSTPGAVPDIEQPSQWLNLTGYPPMPTGVSTIAQPEAVEKEDGCVQTTTMWSCAVPKEEQQAISPNKPDQPNLKIEIIFENGTISDASKTRPAKRAANPVSAGSLVRSRFLNTRASPSASPAAPEIEDYKFLGENTDDNQTPFEGEDTPFFISVLDTKGTAPSRFGKRADDDLTKAIPQPMLKPDGTAAPANLLPLTSGQPLRLFNRGKEDEHYGFFIYYDRSIFLKETIKNFTLGGNPADRDGGSDFDAATMRCTWAQTRFLVQIWTRSQSKKPLLGSPSNTNSDATLTRPGSFPYPVTITIDRHGGLATRKMLYCYKMETNGKIIDLPQNKQFGLEDRGFGGNIVNPAGGFDKNVTGPVDGGTGGCHCRWQNWLA